MKLVWKASSVVCWGITHAPDMASAVEAVVLSSVVRKLPQRYPLFSLFAVYQLCGFSSFKWFHPSITC
jgi:hypothetical protein